MAVCDAVSSPRDVSHKVFNTSLPGTLLETGVVFLFTTIVLLAGPHIGLSNKVLLIAISVVSCMYIGYLTQNACIYIVYLIRNLLVTGSHQVDQGKSVRCESTTSTSPNGNRSETIAQPTNANTNGSTKLSQPPQESPVTVRDSLASTVSCA
jgi:hypothetical protein